MQILDDKVSTNYNNIVKIATTVGSFDESTDRSFQNLSEKLRQFVCKIDNNFTKISYAMQLDQMIIKLCRFSWFNSFYF